MIIAFGKSLRALLILFFRVSGVSFLLIYPIIRLSGRLLNRPWLIDPIIQGLQLVLEPLKELNQKLLEPALDFEQEIEGAVLLLPAPIPPKRDINQATVEELRAIEGVGFVRALEIVEYRERFGDYRRLEELGLIRGVGSQTLKILSTQYEIKAIN